MFFLINNRYKEYSRFSAKTTNKFWQQINFPPKSIL